MASFRIRSLAEKIQKKRFWFRRKSKSPSPKGTWKKRILWTLGIGAFLTSAAGVSFVVWVIRDVPHPSELEDIFFAQSSSIYDASGENILYNLHGDENRTYVSIEQISPHMITALLAAEDADFYTHSGVDFMGLLRSVYYLLQTGEIAGGGSTITQQLAKNTLLTREKSIIRKIKEIYLAFRIEKHFQEKEEILELYLNKVPFGNNAYGIEQAAKTYFGKSASDLSLSEGIVLASIPQAPTKWSPYGNRKYSTLNISPEQLIAQGVDTEEKFWALRKDGFNPVKQGLLGINIPVSDTFSVFAPGRVNYVLDQLQEKNFISDLEYQKTRQELLQIEFIPYRQDITAPHFVFFVREFVEQELAKILGEEEALKQVEQGGLTIVTTLDADLQQKAEELALKNATANDAYDISNIALISAEPTTGYIRAFVGSRDYWSEDIDGKVDVIRQARQPGSSFKPIAFAAGFEKGLSPATVMFDVETRFGSTTPQNFDGEFRGPVTLRQSLGNSLNVTSVKVGIISGSGMYNLAQGMGLNLQQNADFYGSSLALGTGETSPLAMAQAYSVFAMNGKKIPLVPVLYVKDSDGNILLDFRTPPEDPEQVLDERIAYLITDVLSDPEARGEGWNDRLQLRGRTNASKTGTSNAVDPNTGRKYPNDTWTIGYTPDFVTAVWAGNNRGYIKNNRASGWQNAGLYWKEFMEYAHQNKTPTQFQKPQGLKTIAIDKFSGKLPAEDLDEQFIIQDLFLSEHAPTEVGETLRFVEIDKVSGKIPTQYTPPDAIEKRALLNFTSYQPDNPLWEAPVQKWVEENGSEFIAEFGGKNFLTTLPEGEDDVHNPNTADDKPSIRIISPIDSGVVTPPYIDVVSQISAPHGVRMVEILWNGELTQTITRAPWNTQISIGTPEKGSEHQLTVRAIDRLYYADESTLNVKIGEDNIPPQVTFLLPQAEQTLAGGGAYRFEVNAIDQRSSVDRVLFSLNGRRLGTASQAPFSILWTAPNQNAQYTLTAKAFDTAGNASEQEILFSTSSTSSSDEFQVLSPANNSTLSSPVYVTVAITEENARNFESLEILYKTPDGPPKTLETFSRAPEGRTFSALLTGQKGDVEIWARIKLSSGGNQISGRSRITVE